ncbi:methyltransferase domain-containing protein [Candidatus Dependentiae bacterium]|nr:methyltransferase domain-containing protein [Candidatus Dependentiae bacterium]
MNRLVGVMLLMTSMLLADDMSQHRACIFEHIYTTNCWGSCETRSGTGSEILHTREIRMLVPAILKALGVKTLLDAGCGECNWIKEAKDLDLDLYIGADVVPSMVEINRQRFGDDMHCFLHLDIVSEKLPKADAILCRDCLAHMSHADILSSLRNFKRSGAKYLIATNYPNIKKNTVDVGTGGYYPINLLEAPFNLPQPIMLFAELSAEPDAKRAGKWLCVWRLDDIQVN